MLDTLKKYCAVPAVSGDEAALRNVILDDIEHLADHIEIDPLGNIIAFRRGKNRAAKKVMIDAHMDEVGFIVTSVTKKGYLRFDTVGGIDEKVLFGRRVKIGDVSGVIGGCAVHLLESDEKAKVQPINKLFIDIGANSREEALEQIQVGDTAVFDAGYMPLGDRITARALDDRIGSAVLTEMIRQPQEYDMYFTYTVGEEVGCRGAVTAAYAVDPDFAIAVEATTASDLHDVDEGSEVCRLGQGAVVSFMDNGTVYDRELYQLILKTCAESGIPAQLKTAVKGGNNASKIHLSRSGVRTAALSLPCRYIHSAQCTAAKSDMQALFNAVKISANLLASGKALS